MKKIYFLIIYLILFSTNANSQCFECIKTQGGTIFALEKTNSGFITIVDERDGYNNGYGQTGGKIKNYDSNCNLIWEKIYNSSFSEENPYSIKVDNDGNFYVFEYTFVHSYEGKNITKFNQNGDQLWEITFARRNGEDHPLTGYWNAILVDYLISENRIYITGFFKETLIFNGEVIYDFRDTDNHTNKNHFISEFDLNGNYISTKIISRSSGDSFSNGVIDNNGNIYHIKNNSRNSIIEKYNSNLELIYSKVISSSNTSNDITNIIPKKIFYSKNLNKIIIFGGTSLNTSLGNEIINFDDVEFYNRTLLIGIDPSNGNILNYKKLDFIENDYDDPDYDQNFNSNYFEYTEDNHRAYILTTFNREININGQIIAPKISTRYANESPPIFDTNIVLLQIDPLNFNFTFKLATNTGLPELDHTRDLGKFVRILDENNLLLSGEFKSKNFEINNINIPNQSNNELSDFFIYKYNLNNQANNISLNIKNTCLGIPTNFSIDGNFDSILWNFGDGTTSTENNPIHQYNYSGTYNVIAFITCNGETREFSKNIVITPPINLEEISEINTCEENSNTGIGIFNTTHIPSLLLQNRNDIELKYYSSNNTEIRNFISDSYQNTTQFNERITIKAFYRNNPTCISETILNLNVLPKTELPNIQEELVFCYTNLKQFNEININGENLKFYDEAGNQIDSNQEISSGVYFVTATTDGKCESNRIELNILIQQTLPPTSDTIQTFCTELNPTIAQLQANGENIKWYETLNSQTPLPYNTLLINGKTYYATQTNQNCESFNRVSTTVNLYNQTITTVSFIEICKDFNTIATFDLTEKRNELARDLGISSNQILFFTNLNDAQNNQNPIENYLSNTRNLIEIYATIISNDPCKTYYKIPLIEHINPTINLENEYYKCKEASIYLTLDQEYDSIEWSNQSTSNSIEISSPGLYSVKVKNGTCETIHYFRINDFQDLNIEHTYDGQTVSFNILNNQYTKISIDQINWNNSSFIIPPGNHTFYFKSINGCIEEHQIYIYKNLPTFISPNGDGINDIWNLDYLKELKSIKIFNRYGKLIFHKLKDNQPIKWDGKFNGNILPSDSYWYTIDLINNQKIEGYILIKNK